MYTNNWNYQDKFREIVNTTGGKTDVGYVLSSGCMIVTTSSITSESSFLFDYVNIDSAAPGYERLAEFNTHLPHLDFKQSQRTGKNFHENGPIKYSPGAFKHMSVGFILAGISLETSFDLTNQPGAKVTKLISSDTLAMNDPFYRIQGTESQISEFKSYLSRVVNPSSFSLPTEFKNMMLPSCKATIIVFTMNLCEYDELFRKLIEPHGSEFKEILSLMCDKLSRSYPLAIRPTKEYRNENKV